jgi:hypothetical protein
MYHFNSRRNVNFSFLIIILALFAFVSTTQTVNAATFTVSNINDNGEGSLRQAIVNANALSGIDTIAFSINSGIQTITPITPLPDITDQIIIDGTTQPAFSGVPLIVIDGINIRISNTYGLRINAGNSLIKGLVMNNFLDGGAIALATAGGNIIQGNYIGTDATGMIRRANYVGISIFSYSDNNLIGGTTPSQRNIIAGSRFENIGVYSGTANQIKGNFIGTNAQGTASMGTGGYGVKNEGGESSIIGGTEPGAGNLISGNGQSGIYLGGWNAIVQGNFIGTDVTGTKSIPNTSSGIYVSGIGTELIGGITAAARNIISGNTAGITYSASSSNPTGRIQGNYIGTDVTGMVALPNGYGIYVNDQVTIGGTEPGAGNVISGNSSSGIYLNNRNSIVQGNFIGTDAAGLGPLANSAQKGIVIGDSYNLIGGSQPTAANVISGNSTGVQIGGSSSSPPEGNKIQGNFIGADRSGNNPIPNTNNGIIISAGSNNIIGGINPGEGNVIAFNNGKGIFVSSAFFGLMAGNAIRRNSIFLNNELGIDLGVQGITMNDLCDADTGANNLQNYPILVSAISNEATANITGSLNSTANKAFAIDFYASPTPDASGFGEGKIYLGSTNIITAGDCNVNFNVKMPFSIAENQFITATATDVNGNTSEFSAYSTVRKATTAQVRGHVTDPNGIAVEGTQVTITDPQGNTQTTITSSSGEYIFNDNRVGESYTVSVSDSRYRFTQPSQVVSVNDQGNEVNFIASPPKSRKRVRFF